MNKKLINALLQEGYCTHSAEAASQELESLDAEDLKEAINTWLTEGTCPRVGQAPYDTTTLMRNHGMKYPGAILFIAWLRQFPESALKSLLQ